MKPFLSACAALAALLGLSTLAIASQPSEAPPQLIAATPRVEAPSQGPVDARVTVEVWSDFQCPFCAKGAATVQQLRQKYGDQVRIVFRHQPLPFHESARPAAIASMAAHEQGRFWEFHDALFANQRALDRESLLALAGKLKLDVERFRRELASSTWSQYVEAEVTEARRRGVSGTPTFFINGKPLVGAQPLAAFTQAIDAELGR